MDWDLWLQTWQEAHQSPQQGHIVNTKRVHFITQEELMTANEDEVDSYMDWFAANFGKTRPVLDPTSNSRFAETMYSMFQLADTSQKTTQTNTAKEKLAKLEHIKKVVAPVHSLGAQDIKARSDKHEFTPGARDYKRYRSWEELKLHGSPALKRFHEAVARFIGVPFELMFNMLVHYEMSLGQDAVRA